MTDYAVPRRAIGRLRLKYRRGEPPDPDPPRRISWEVWTSRFWLFRLDLIEVPLGYVNAKTRDEALELARTKWPTERRLRVSVHEEF